jgi:hypothetical protein
MITLAMMDYLNDGGDVERLRSFYKNNSDFRAVLDFVNAHGKSEGWEDASDLTARMNASGVGVNRAQIISAFKMLATLRCGWFTVGRRKWPTRLEFRADPRQLHKLATASSPVASVAPTMLTHRFRLRPELEISVYLPSDVSKKEISRIADFLQTLPFDHAELRIAA